MQSLLRKLGLKKENERDSENKINARKILEKKHNASNFRKKIQ